MRRRDAAPVRQISLGSFDRPRRGGFARIRPLGCGSGDNPAATAAGDTAARTAPQAGGSPSAPSAGRTAAAPVANAAGLPTPSETLALAGARYTIFCAAFNGPARVQQATVSRDNLVRATSRREFYVVHEEAQSTLYFGYYKERERTVDAAEAARSGRDLEYLRSLVDGEQHRIFTRSLVVPLPLPDVEGPPEFDLTKLDQDKSPDDPKRRFWSIAIADYTNDARLGDKNRKQLAVEAVIDARKRGVEAYYYNGPNTSTVCVGAWPRSAIRAQDTGEAKTRGDTGRDIIVSNGPVSPQITEGLRANGRDVEVFQPMVQIDDPGLEKTWNEWKQYSVNGETVIEKSTNTVTRQESKKEKPSFLFEIPRNAPASLLAGNRDAVQQESGPTVVNPLAPTGSGGSGRLRSVTP